MKVQESLAILADCGIENDTEINKTSLSCCVSDVYSTDARHQESWSHGLLQEFFRLKEVTSCDFDGDDSFPPRIFEALCSSSQLDGLRINGSLSEFEAITLAAALTPSPPRNLSNSNKRRKRNTSSCQLGKLSRLELDVFESQETFFAICKALETNTVVVSLHMERILDSQAYTVEREMEHRRNWDAVLQMIKHNKALKELCVVIADAPAPETDPETVTHTDNYVLEQRSGVYAQKQLSSILEDHNRSMEILELEGLWEVTPPNIQQSLDFNYYGFGFIAGRPIIGGDAQGVTQEVLGKALVAAKEKEKESERPLVSSLFRVLRGNPLLVNFVAEAFATRG